MNEIIKIGDLKVKCNIDLHELQSLSIHEAPGTHATAMITARMEYGELDVPCFDLSGQPIMVCVKKGGKEQIIFNGVINEIRQVREAEYDTIHILAYSLSWLMDIEKKSRSFQNSGESVLGLIKKIADEYCFHILCSVDDKLIVAPFIQYEETDWEFLQRLSTHLSAPVIAAANYQNRGIYIGFPEGVNDNELEASSEKWCMDKTHVKFANWRTWSATYYEVQTRQICYPGERISYNRKLMWVHNIHMILQQGVLQCVYRLADIRYQPISVIYNEQLQGLSLIGTVLAQSQECIKVHLDMDDQQDIATAYEYPWLPDFGNLVYCMPEVGSKIRLLIPDGDEQKAIGIHCVRQNKVTGEDSLEPDNRYFFTKEGKRMALNPGALELTTAKDTSRIALQDDCGSVFSSKEGILIQAEGRLILQGANVVLKAPQEITTMRRQLGSPTVVNICHNLDSMGKYTTFKNLDELRPEIPAPKVSIAKDKKIILSEAEEAGQKEEREKLMLKMKALMEKEEERNTYDLGSSITRIMAAIPQDSKMDELSRIATGFRPIIGKMRGE